MVEDNGTPPNASDHEASKRRTGLFGSRRTGRRALVVPRAADDALGVIAGPPEATDGPTPAPDAAAEVAGASESSAPESAAEAPAAADEAAETTRDEAATPVGDDEDSEPGADGVAPA
ncbi:MAG TPA: hypothetical protein VFR98_01585, partial [Agromyces sp.]|nr:hypothetical protein [Agromyces sp.]